MLRRELGHALADLGADARRHGPAIDDLCCHCGGGGYRGRRFNRSFGRTIGRSPTQGKLCALV